MNCPYCGKLVSEGAMFCGYCGCLMDANQVKGTQQMPPAAQSSASEVKEPDTFTEQEAPKEIVVPLSPSKNKTAGRRSGFKVFLVFITLAALSGGTIGFLIARGTIELKRFRFIKSSDLLWTDITEGYVEIEEAPEGTEAKDVEEKETGVALNAENDNKESGDVPQFESGTDRPQQDNSDNPWSGNWVYIDAADGLTISLSLLNNSEYRLKNYSDGSGESDEYSGYYTMVNSIEELNEGGNSLTVLGDVSGQKLVIYVDEYLIFHRLGQFDPSPPDPSIVGDWNEKDAMGALSIRAESFLLRQGSELTEYGYLVINDGSMLAYKLNSVDANVIDDHSHSWFYISYHITSETLVLNFVGGDRSGQTNTFIKSNQQ